MFKERIRSLLCYDLKGLVGHTDTGDHLGSKARGKVEN